MTTNLTRFDNDGLELFINTQTRECFASLPNIARIVEVPEKAIRYVFNEAGIHPVIDSSGVGQIADLYDDHAIYEAFKRLRPDMREELFTLGLKAVARGEIKMPTVSPSPEKKDGKGNKKTEARYSNALAKSLKGKREVHTPVGKIDVLTPSQVIEVKKVEEWKSALGQVLAYGSYYPSHEKRIHLYGKTQESFLRIVEDVCKKADVIVTWEA